MAKMTSEAFRFMGELQDNNNKTWFDENRERYERHVREPMKAMAEALAGPMGELLPEFTGKSRVSRINNDIRFSPNKPPYKEHMWVSFGTGGSACQEMFFGIDRNGWCAGCTISSNKREPLDEWRQNLLTHFDLWNRYGAAYCSGANLKVYTGDKYKKPLYPDIPDILRDTVQAKGLWIVSEPRDSFGESPEKDALRELCRMLPIHLYMLASPATLRDRLNELGGVIPAPDEEVAAQWKIVHT